jgi:hypothetical protein
MATLLHINENAFSILKLYLNDKTSSACQQYYEFLLTAAVFVAGEFPSRMHKAYFHIHKSLVLRILIFVHTRIRCTNGCPVYFSIYPRRHYLKGGGGLLR